MNAIERVEGVQRGPSLGSPEDPELSDTSPAKMSELHVASSAPVRGRGLCFMGLDASGLLVGLRLEDIRSPPRGGAGGVLNH